GVGRGYLGDGGQTGEKYVPNPFSGNEGERMYRTGDVSRYRCNGEIEYLGRMDEQVKVRGYRIELGEIEGVLIGHRKVKAAAVVVREEEGVEEKRLAGYVVLEEWEKPGEEREIGEELRGYLRERLPEYMVPQAIVMLAEMPLTANRKIDRLRLPSPEGWY